MKRPTAVTLFALVSVIFGLRDAEAYCLGSDRSLPNYNANYYSVPSEFARARYVVIARMVTETWLGEDGRPEALRPPFHNGNPRPSGLDAYLGTYYDLRVLRTLKGSHEGHLRVFSENSTGRFSLSEPGAEYLLFITDGTFDVIGSQLTVDNCGSSGSEPSRALLRSVERLSRQIGPSSQ